MEVGERVHATVSGYIDDNTGWTTAKNHKDILVDFKPTPCEDFPGGNLYRGQMEIQVPKEVIIKYVNPLHGGELRKKWDKDVNDLRTLRQIGDNTWILHTLTNSAALGMISPRDFVDCLVKSETAERIITCGVSVDYPECASLPKYVRGWNHPCGNLLLDVPGKPGYTRIVNFIQPDIKGMLPKSLVEGAIPTSIIGFFTNLRNILKKDGCLRS